MSETPVCLLALDGGGIRGLSELLILEEIMDRIKYDLGMADDPLPADFFDLIGGTSTGGWIALLLGRVRLSVPEARKAYIRIAKEVFSMDRYARKSKFDGKKLEERVKRVLQRNLGESHSEERLLDRSSPSCKTFVCAVPKQDTQARGKSRNVCNTGAGLARGVRLSNPEVTNPVGLINALKDIANEADATAERVQQQLRHLEAGTYFRFNVDHGLDEIALEEWEHLSEVRTYTKEYLDQDEISSNIDKIVLALLTSKADLSQGSSRAYVQVSVPRSSLSTARRFTRKTQRQRWRAPELRPEFNVTVEDFAVTGGSFQENPEVFEDDYSEYYQLDSAPPPSSGRYSQQWIGPFQNPSLGDGPADFVGRDAILAQALELVRATTANGICIRTAIEGHGGNGKTRIALEVASRIYQQDPNFSVFWVSAVDAATFENGYCEIGHALNVPNVGDDRADFKSLVKTALSQCASDWLLVIDNADDMDLFYGKRTSFHKYLPFTRESAGYKGSILFTTRSHKVAVQLATGRGFIVDVQRMTRGEAHSLLERCIGPTQPADAENVSQLLDYLKDQPLAIKQATAYIQRHRVTIAEYLGLCDSRDSRNKSSQKPVDKGPEAQGSHRDAGARSDHRDAGGQKDHQDTGKPVTASLRVSLEQIARSEPLATEYIKFMSFLIEKDISFDILPAPQHNRRRLIAAIDVLKRYGLISENRKELYQMHRLVRVESVLVGKLAASSRLLGKHDEAEDLYRLNLRLQKEMLGPNAHETLATMRNLADSLRQQKKYKEAEDLYQQTLDLSTYTHGSKTPETLATMNHLANTQSSQGKYKAAEDTYLQAVELAEDLHGPEASGTLTIMNNLADCLQSQGMVKEAEELSRYTLQLRRKAAGLEAADTIMNIHNLADSLFAQEKYREAEDLYDSALQLWRKARGPEAPETITAMNNLGHSLYKQKQYKAAEERWQETLQLQKESLDLKPIKQPRL
ncbi:unnamed protein product [Parascedosporium putredinis]|uniref:PNPLA domain-containing protein n=2 Tax=Parascedosporium putredinis TaxID=1442378 RepID=A0A9P1M8V5_9PEZI|nr:unnamed protein product [Parascedosporium putredinis]CAI7990772.1 unnamed protein product [Parascedosporium putredinis]